MTLFLASVTSPAEAELALAGGADIIDCKDPAKGALGALAPAAVSEIVRTIGGAKPVSAVTGDLPMQPDVIAAAAQAMAAAGADYIKVGLFPSALPGAARADCIRALAPLAARHKIIGVLFADRSPDFELLALLAQSGFAGAMLDTAGKGAGRLLTHQGMPALDAFIKACKAKALLCGLAGSLEPPDVPRLLALSPDFLGFRGALCAGGARGARLDAAALAHIRSLIAPRSAPAPAGSVTDRIFVSDFTVAMRIGAYAHELIAPQRVRFNVEASVARSSHQGDDMHGDMRDVFSYDLITDAIRMLAAAETFTLAETVAERVAALVLQHPRARHVRVRVEKLDLGPYRVGVEIERERPD